MADTNKPFVVQAAEKWLEIQPESYVKSLVASLLDLLEEQSTFVTTARKERDRVVMTETQRIVQLERQLINAERTLTIIQRKLEDDNNGKRQDSNREDTARQGAADREGG